MKLSDVATSTECRSCRSRKGGFTLVELLVVITIILVLVGISLKIMGSVGNRITRARTLWELEQVKNALAAYYSANGFYPPSDKWNRNSWYASSKFFTENGLKPLCETDGIIFDESIRRSYPDASDPYTSMGLAYYLYTDPQASKWTNYLAGIMSLQTFSATNTSDRSGPTPATLYNQFARCFDEWRNSVHYECFSNNNYQQFRLWSSGADGLTNTPDDVGVGWQDQ